MTTAQLCRLVLLCLLVIPALSAITCLAPIQNPPPADCLVVLNAVPALEFRPDAQAGYDKPTFTIPRNAYNFKLPAAVSHGDCRLSIIARPALPHPQNHVIWNNHQPVLTPPADVMQLTVWRLLREEAQRVFDRCVSNNFAGYSQWNVDIPGYQTVLMSMAFRRRAGPIRYDGVEDFHTYQV